MPKHNGAGYPPPFDAAHAGRIRRRLDDACGLSDFGVNLRHLPPGYWSSQRHWHSHEDEFVYVLAGEVVLVEDDVQTMCAPRIVGSSRRAAGSGVIQAERAEALIPGLEAHTARPDVWMAPAKMFAVVGTKAA